ncbi:MAG: PQQ-binding-like beta-propeller repeat protein [Nitrososphaerota archaeon]
MDKGKIYPLIILINILIIQFSSLNLIAAQEEIKEFLPKIDYNWPLLKADETSSLSTLSSIPRRPSIAFNLSVSVNIDGLATPLIENGIVFLADKGGIYAINDKNGELIWGVEIYSDSLEGRKIGPIQPVTKWKAYGLWLNVKTYGLGKYVYIATEGTSEKKSKIIAIDKMNGEKIWQSDIGDTVTSNLLIHNGNIYVGTMGKEGKVFCFNEDGKILWSTFIGGTIRGIAASEDKIFVTVEDSNKLHALNAKDGKIIWIYEHSGSLGTPAYKKGLIFSIGLSGEVIAISEDNGKLKWKTRNYIGSCDVYSNSFLSIDEEKIYVGGRFGEKSSLTIINFNGEIIANFTLPKNEIPKSLVAAKDIILLPVTGKGYTRVYFLWRGIFALYNLTQYGEEIAPKISVAYGKIYIVFAHNIYKLHDIEKPVIVSIDAPKEVYENEDFKVRIITYDNRSAIYRVILGYNVNNTGWKYEDMEIERRYVMEPIGGYGLSEEPYIGKIPAKPAGSNVKWRIIAIDNVGNYITSDEYSYVVLKALKDNIPPTISSMTPPPNSIISERKPKISAKFADEGSGIDVSSIIIKLDGNDVTSLSSINEESFTYIPIEELSEGSHNVVITIKDKAGNQQTASWTFTISIPSGLPLYIYAIIAIIVIVIIIAAILLKRKTSKK